MLPKTIDSELLIVVFFLVFEGGCHIYDRSQKSSFSIKYYNSLHLMKIFDYRILRKFDDSFINSYKDIYIYLSLSLLRSVPLLDHILNYIKIPCK